MLKIPSSSRHHPLYSRRRVTRCIPLGAERFLAAFEGIEGGFAIGTSVVVALSLAGLERNVLLITAIVSIIVSGFNSSAVKYSSEHYMDELDGREKRSPFRHYFTPAIIEFVCYFLLSFLSVLPLVVMTNVPTAVGISLVVTLVLLYGAGLWRGYTLRMNKYRDATEALLLGAVIIAVGAVSGLLLHSI